MASANGGAISSSDGSRGANSSDSVCDFRQRRSCTLESRCSCLFVDRQLQDFWKFRSIAIVFGKFNDENDDEEDDDEEDDDEDDDQRRYVMFDGSESKNPMDWMKIEVRAQSSDRS